MIRCCGPSWHCSIRHGVYGSSKIIGEEIVRTYAARHDMRVWSLRPRAFGTRLLQRWAGENCG